MSQPLLQIAGLRKDFGPRRVLEVAELMLESGHSHVVTGDNGVGKSTLLRILAGLEPARIGEYKFNGAVVALNPYPDWLRREVIYVHQHPYLFNTSVAHNIAYGLRARGIPANEREQLVREAIKWAGVEHLAEVPPQKLSGGEKQRVALARAKVLNPRLFLFDEPTSNLDAEARSQTIELIERLCLENNCVLIACHDRELINLPHMRRFSLIDGALTSPA